MNDAGTDYIRPEEALTLDGLFLERVHRTPRGLAYCGLERDGSTRYEWRWADMARETARWQQALADEGLQRGDRVAILLRNCPQWVMFEQAALGLGLVVVPLYVDDRPDSSAYMLTDSGARLLLIAEERHRRLAPTLEKLPQLQRIVIVGNGAAPSTDPRACSLPLWLPPKAGGPLARTTDPDALATIVYTSGTAGRPKGVMLSHRNILTNAYASASVDRFGHDDLFLSFLPLSHMLERTGGYYLPMLAGATVAYARSVQQLPEELRRLQPTVLIAVPRLFEQLYARIHSQLQQRPRPVRWLFRTATAVGWRRFEARQGRGRRGPWDWSWPLLQRLVAAPLLERMGGRLRLAVSGGAPLSTTVSRLFLSLGMQLVQGYGLTEASPVISVNLPADNEPAGVGPAIPGIELRLGVDNELLARGPNVMQGYWHDEPATAAAIDADGWLHTGDQVALERGHIRITGRLKDILVLSNGEKVPPADLEGAITLDPLFEHAVVVGEGQPYLAALVAIDTEQWATLAPALGFAGDAATSVDEARLQRLVLQRIQTAMHDFPGYARVRRTAVTFDSWTVDNGMLTPTMKLRRGKVLEHYARTITAMFD